eukprot:144838-Prorocentrum_minimum.AAC.1
MPPQRTQVLAVTRPAGVPLLINDRVDVCLASGADGVHVGQSDLAAVYTLSSPLIGRPLPWFARWTCAACSGPTASSASRCGAGSPKTLNPKKPKP